MILKATGGVYAPQPMYQTAPMMGGFPPGGVLGTPNRMIGIPLQSNCVPQAVPSTNPFGPWGIGPPGGAVLDRSLSNPGQGTPRLGQIQNQMASLQLQGQSWNMMGNIQNQNPHAEHINLGSLSLGAPQPAPGTFFQAPTLSSSLWR
ncbi:uncharacterized protein LOC106472198 [Limulus polyphemus]|uniref:Uncharacterized protein LOC106472198 n=1 Tax=Limulus polyphemus TaxID=6850 RepID=A0ABM1BTC6_LIMPO|nr:uncharacterized protein LOC106472198 [Limulus polyphemus]